MAVSAIARGIDGRNEMRSELSWRYSAAASRAGTADAEREQVLHALN